MIIRTPGAHFPSEVLDSMCVSQLDLQWLWPENAHAWVVFEPPNVTVFSSVKLIMLWAMTIFLGFL